MENRTDLIACIKKIDIVSDAGTKSGSTPDTISPSESSIAHKNEKTIVVEEVVTDLRRRQTK